MDRDAFNTLAREHYVPLVRFARSLIANSDTAGKDAEDIVQDVLYRTWHLREKLNPQTSIAAYLFTAVRNAAFNVRKQGRAIDKLRERISLNASDDAAFTSLQQSSSFTDETSLALAKAFVRLPETQQSALRLRYKYDMGYVEIASILNVTPKAAERLLARGLETLRKTLGGSSGKGMSAKDLRGFLMPLIVIWL